MLPTPSGVAKCHRRQRRGGWLSSIKLLPGQEETLEPADQERQEERERDGHHHAGEYFGNDVKATRLEDRMAEPVVRGHEFAHNGSNQRKADRELEAREDVAQ